MAEDVRPTAEQDETPEVEAHSEAVLELQGMDTEDPQNSDVISPGSCSSCVGSFCS